MHKLPCYVQKAMKDVLVATYCVLDTKNLNSHTKQTLINI